LGKKSVILIAAKGLIARFGLKKTTTDDIAKKAKVSKATVYRYYKNKGEIFQELCNLEVDGIWNDVEKAVNQETAIRDKLAAHLVTKTAALHDLVRFYVITPELWDEYLPYIRIVQDRIASREIALLAEVLRTGNESGELNVEQIDLIAHIMVTSLKALENPWALGRQSVPLPEYISAMLDALLYGIAKR